MTPNVKKAKGSARAAKGTKTLTLERVFDAPPETLWAYWTDPEKYATWFNPAGIKLVIHEFDVRPGGRVRFDMPQPDGSKNPQEGVFHVLDLHREIVSGEADKSFLVAVRFEPVGRKTRMTVVVTGIPAEYREGAVKGWSASFDHLEARLNGRKDAGSEGLRTTFAFPSDREIVMTSFFDAPRDRVFEAYNDPGLIPEWWGPRSQKTRVDTMDVRPGGRWRYVSQDVDGSEYGFRGEYREIAPPERVVATFEYEGMPGHVSVNTATFESIDGKTKVTIRSVFASKGDRDGMVQSGMEGGARETHERFAELLARPGSRTTAKGTKTPRGFTIERTLKAPPEKVWSMWTTKAGLEKWWTGGGWASTVTAIDVRVGGKYDIAMTDGKQTIHNHGTYTEVVRPRRLAWIWRFDIFLGPGDEPYDVPITVEFAAVPGGTKMTFTQGPLATEEFTEGSRQGVLSNFQALAKALEG